MRWRSSPSRSTASFTSLPGSASLESCRDRRVPPSLADEVSVDVPGHFQVERPSGTEGFQLVGCHQHRPERIRGVLAFRGSQPQRQRQGTRTSGWRPGCPNLGADAALLGQAVPGGHERPPSRLDRNDASHPSTLTKPRPARCPNMELPGGRGCPHVLVKPSGPLADVVAAGAVAGPCTRHDQSVRPVSAARNRSAGSA